MKLSPVNIGGIQTPNNIFLAPLAGYTNYPFRRLCKELGAGLCYTEMVSAKATCPRIRLFASNQKPRFQPRLAAKRQNVTLKEAKKA